ncbi:MAG: protein translocase subunit SecD [Anaerolineales bacterium]|nr:protein translocase subunit SecD [Anaerolineales bacterium]MCS7247213.1 protein translocase subunit SecD [Anaerolineales bacterium]MDW8161024.1 protein translocase subunit SecD [Anaerolineales bacterium]MDW8445790.1 protein translocase subunit SecD [Anaerolineales bacterium]
MTRNMILSLVAIFIILALSIYLVLPTTTSFLGRPIVTKLGLDLVGGQQVVLQVDLPENAVPDRDLLVKASQIVENRVNGLGVAEAVVQLAGNRYINVELPAVKDVTESIDTLKQTGVLEFVDMSHLSDEEAFALIDQTIRTDLEETLGSETTSPITTTGVVTETVFHTIMTGAMLESVETTTNQLGEPVVSFRLTPEGTKIFAEHTRQHQGKILAIVLDKKVISTPRIREPIETGEGVIEGNFTLESANALTVQLRYGSLPVPLKVAETRTIGPTLGEDSLRKSLVAGAIGFTIVILFMILYYRLPGVVAISAILTYALITFAIFRTIPVTLTLPGIAGFLLSTGSALDANILIFERFKEELRSGRPLGLAVDIGWKRAWPSIRDSNIATILTSLILFWFGSTFGATIVKGFSLTLLIGVLVSLFSAIVVTRTFLNLVFLYFQPSNYAKWFGL